MDMDEIIRKIRKDPRSVDPVEVFSKGFEEDLRRILGDKYKEHPKRKRPKRDRDILDLDKLPGIWD